MQSQFTIRVRSALLLVIFSLNSIVGFACSMGINLGYNRSHHNQKLKTSENFSHCDFGEAQDEPGSATSEDDCCKDEVLKFTLLDKSVSSLVKIDPPVQIALEIVAAYFLVIWDPQLVSSTHYFVQSDHPPISKDIRVAINSFQI